MSTLTCRTEQYSQALDSGLTVSFVTLIVCSIT